eukprot:PhF_6_TR41672/c0_g1_i2/m.63183
MTDELKPSMTTGLEVGLDNPSIHCQRTVCSSSVKDGTLRIVTAQHNTIRYYSWSPSGSFVNLDRGAVSVFQDVKKKSVISSVVASPDREFLYIVDTRGHVARCPWFDESGSLYDDSDRASSSTKKVKVSDVKFSPPEPASACPGWCGIRTNAQGTNLVVARQMDGDVQCYDTTTGQLTTTFSAQYSPVSLDYFEPLGLIALCENCDVGLYDVRASGRKCVQRARGGMDPLLTIQCAADGLYVGGYGRAITHVEPKKWLVRNAVSSVLKYEINTIKLVCRDPANATTVTHAIVAGTDSEMQYVDLGTKKALYEAHGDDAWVGGIGCHETTACGVTAAGSIVVADFSKK